LRKLGVRFGAHYIYVPTLVKPAIRVLATQLWALRQGGSADGASLHEIPQLAASGRTSFLADSAIPKETYRVAGFRLCGDRAVRVDIVERLADLIRPAAAYRSGVSAGAPPPGSADGDGFVVTGAMTSLTGCSGEQFASVLRSLGFVSHLVKGSALTLVEKAPEAPPEKAPDAPRLEDDAPTPAPTETPATEDSPYIADAAAESGVDPGETLEASSSDGSVTAGDATAAPANDVPDETASCDPPETDGAAAQMSEPAPNAEGVANAEAEQVLEALVEVWRPRPPVRHRSPRGGARDRAPAQVAEGDGQPVQRGEASDEAGGRRRRPAPRPPPKPGAEAEASPQAEPDRFRGGRGNRRPSGSANSAQGSHRARSGQSADKPKDERGRRERRPEEAPPPVARREPPINLDSPFAKLLALKLQLETKGKGD
jgi:ATP-dependent RNA helicase SUPV3L1/SUV3